MDHQRGLCATYSCEGGQGRLQCCNDTGLGCGIADDCRNPEDEGEGLEALACNSDGSERTCDGSDDDCDGETDDGFGLGEACEEGLGECRVSGTVQCDPEDDTGTICDPDATPPLPAPEVCNEKDDDCDGEVDEDCGPPGGPSGPWPYGDGPGGGGDGCDLVGGCGGGAPDPAAGDRCESSDGGKVDLISG
ncbi:MAG: MopE-related protein [Deltaproteobacteria bacterium]|nr:MopE-related protein [Deltaproteobacteria bacterium]